mmetsp:Transcript_12852/g.16668  ORF Transcript_12852/g.16668 Transcript_12852/m.16668 type:complete len:447 (+) Transcript_12852:95-1435(+)
MNRGPRFLCRSACWTPVGFNVRTSALRHSSVRFCSFEQASVWWPEESATISSLPEIAEARELLKNNKFQVVQERLDRASEICASAFGSDHPATLSIIVAKVKTAYELGDDKSATSLISKLYHSHTIQESEFQLETVAMSYLKLLLLCGNSKEIHTVNEGLKQREPVSIRLSLLSSLSDILYGSSLSFENENFLLEFSKWKEVSDSYLNQLDEKDRGLEMYHLASGVFSRYGRDNSWSRDQEKLSVLKEYTSNSLRKSREILKSLEPKFKEIEDENEEVATSAASSLSQASPELTKQYSMILNMLVLQNPTEQDSQKYLTSSLRLVQDNEGLGNHYKAALALVLGTMARSFHINGKAISSEGLYRSAIQKIRSLEPKRQQFQNSELVLLESYSELLKGWENRESDLAAVTSEIESLKNDDGMKLFTVELDNISNWNLPEIKSGLLNI